MKGLPNSKKCKGSGMKLSKRNEIKPCKCMKKIRKSKEKERKRWKKER